VGVGIDGPFEAGEGVREADVDPPGEPHALPSTASTPSAAAGFLMPIERSKFDERFRVLFK